MPTIRAYPRLDAGRVKAAIAPLDFYRHELPNMPEPRRASGWVDGGLCPFHDDARSGSFRLNLDTGAFTCFSCGARGGDIIAFVRLRRGLSFPDALARAASEWRVC